MELNMEPNNVCLLTVVKKMRDESAACAKDMFFPDGSIALSKEQGLSVVAAYDDLIHSIKCRVALA